jgi:hypothetical protein
MAKRKAEQERIAAEAEAKKHEELPFDADRSGDAVANPTIAMPQEEVSEDFDNFIPDFAKKLEKKWVALKVNITADDETALLQFLKTKEIEFTVL